MPVPPEREDLERQLESLQRDIQQLQLERDLLKKANEILKKGLCVDLQLLTNREKTLLVDALKELYGLPKLLARLERARSSYFYHRARGKVADKYLAVPRCTSQHHRHLRAEPPLLWLPQAAGFADKAVRHYF